MKKILAQRNAELCNQRAFEITDAVQNMAKLRKEFFLPENWDAIKKDLPSKKNLSNYSKSLKICLKNISNSSNGEILIFKHALIDWTMNSFFTYKPVYNKKYLKFLNKFCTFSAFSLIYASGLLIESNYFSKGDVRSFIYIFLAFNIIASKFLDDFSIWNENYNVDWDLNLNQVMELEALALSGINYNLEVNPNTIETIASQIIHNSNKTYF